MIVPDLGNQAGWISEKNTLSDHKTKWKINLRSECFSTVDGDEVIDFPIGSYFSNIRIFELFAS